MFYILRTVEIPFAATPRETFVIAVIASPDALAATFAAERARYPHDTLSVAETLYGDDVRPAAKDVPAAVATAVLPAELARAIERWNTMAPRCSPPLPIVKAAGRFVTPYRRWKRAAADRTMILEDIVAMIEPATWTHPWIRFGWLFGSKSGDLNYEKLVHRSGERRMTKPGKHAAGNGEDFAAVEK